MTIESVSEIKNSKDRDLVILLQNLIKTPSWVSADAEKKAFQNENQVVDFLEGWLQKNTNMDVQRQELEGGRYNLIAAKGNADLVFLAHTDTVEPSQGSPFDPFAAEIHDGKVWGVGSTDMKSGVASMIQALSLAPDADNVWMFLYADEEKDFLGMHGILEDYGNIKPKLMVSSDGSDLRLGHGCRGLIELRGIIRGVSGHPAKGNGVSSTMSGFAGLFDLQEEFKKYKHPELGGTSLNVTDVIAGKLLADSFDESGALVNVGKAGNEIPDIMQVRLDVRPGNPDLTFDRVVNLLSDSMQKEGLRFELTEKKHSYGAWYTDMSDVDQFLELAKKSTGVADIQIDNPGESGYLDLQMLWEATGRPPSIMFGGGKGNTAHTPQEHIEIEDLIKTRDFFKAILNEHSE